MITINQNFEQIFKPVKALLIYETLNTGEDIYVEAYDIDSAGCPANAHPLSLEETIGFATSLAASKELNSSYLQSASLVPEKLLYTSLDMDGYAVWYSKAQTITLNFTSQLGIPCAMASIPAMVWKADKRDLHVYAIKAGGAKRPTENTILHHAPYFNIYKTGKVCMGTVRVNFKEQCNLEHFMKQWETYFFNSYFSHLMAEHLPVRGNIVQLWKSLSGTGKAFPEKELIKTSHTIKSLLI